MKNIITFYNYELKKKFLFFKSRLLFVFFPHLTKKHIESETKDLELKSKIGILT